MTLGGARVPATHAFQVAVVTRSGCGQSGGAALPTKCATGQGCANNADCNNVLCTAGLLCDAPTSLDMPMNGTETDIDCGGGAPTNAPGCSPGKKCGVDNDCGSKACNYASKCVESISCKTQHGGDTCGPNGNESLGRRGEGRHASRGDLRRQDVHRPRGGARQVRVA